MMSEGILRRTYSRKRTWYAFTALAIAALLALNNREKKFMANLSERQTTVVDTNVTGLNSSKPTPSKPTRRKPTPSQPTPSQPTPTPSEPTPSQPTPSKQTSLQTSVGDNNVTDLNSNKPTPSKPNPIKQISLLGERNSGTRWMSSHLDACFNHTLVVRKRLTRYKHWFQYPNATKYKHDTLVIAEFRNPYHWLEAMRNVPHHAPAHLFKNWTEFVTIPWTTERVGLDLGMPENARCQDDFAYNQIVSCNHMPLPREAYKRKTHYSEKQPFYELKQDGSGEPFANIMEMRAAKIRNYMTIKDYEGVADLWTVHYEDLLAKGTKDLLGRITELTGVPYKCNPAPPQNRPKREISRDFVEYINEHLDWAAEELIGYTPGQHGLEDEEKPSRLRKED